VSLIMILIIGVSRLPKVERIAEEQAGSWNHTPETISQSGSACYFFASTFSTWDRNKAQPTGCHSFWLRIINFDPRTVGANAVSWFWGLMTIGCLLGITSAEIV